MNSRLTAREEKMALSLREEVAINSVSSYGKLFGFKRASYGRMNENEKG